MTNDEWRMTGGWRVASGRRGRRASATGVTAASPQQFFFSLWRLPVGLRALGNACRRLPPWLFFLVVLSLLSVLLESRGDSDQLRWFWGKWGERWLAVGYLRFWRKLERSLLFCYCPLIALIFNSLRIERSRFPPELEVRRSPQHLKKSELPNQKLTLGNTNLHTTPCRLVLSSLFLSLLLSKIALFLMRRF